LKPPNQINALIHSFSQNRVAVAHKTANSSSDAVFFDFGIEVLKGFFSSFVEQLVLDSETLEEFTDHGATVTVVVAVPHGGIVTMHEQTREMKGCSSSTKLV